MTTLDLNIDPEILSDNETAPRAPKEPTVVATASCRFCSDTFTGGARHVQRGLHESRKHPEEYKAAKAAGPVKKAKRATKATKKATPPKKPTTPSSKRVSTADFLSDNIGRAARMLGSANPAMGRALVFSAPATGQAIDEVVAGTIVDRVALQKIAKTADKWDRLGGVLSFPILFGICSARPEMLPMLEPDLREATIDVLIASIPTLMKKKEREKKAFDALAKLGEVDERYKNTDDPVGLMLRDLLFGFPEDAAEDVGGQ